MDEMQLLQAYKMRGDKNALHQLQEKYKPLALSYAQTYRKATVPTSAIIAEVYMQIKKALDTYDVSKGPLANHIKTYVMKVYRYVNNNQNLIRMPENYKLQFGAYNQARNGLEDELNRAPTVGELAKKLGWTQKMTNNFETMAHRTSYFDEVTNEDVFTSNDDLVLQKAETYALSMLFGRDREIGELLAKGEKPAMIQKKLNTSAATISRVKSKLVESMQYYYQKNHTRSRP
jgi:DNA-directed RNA polymerase specialized sigma subunit